MYVAQHIDRYVISITLNFSCDKKRYCESFIQFCYYNYIIYARVYFCSSMQLSGPILLDKILRGLESCSFFMTLIH